MNYDILLNWDLFFWIPAVIALFMGILMFNDNVRYKNEMFRLMLFVFGMIFLKSIIYVAMQLTSILYYTSNELYDNTIQKFIYKPFKEAFPLYDLKYTVWQYFELLFIIVLSYFFIFNRRKAESQKLQGVKVSMWVQIILSTLLAAVTVVLSLQNFKTINIADLGIAGLQVAQKTGADTYGPAIASVVIPNSPIAFINLFHSTIGRWIFVFWKLAILIAAWLSVSSIYGYIANILKTIARSKTIIYAVFGILIFFNLFSAIIPFYASSGWYFVEIFAMVLLAVFAFKIHTDYISSVQDLVENLEKEKDIIIALMKDTSAIVGSGDFDLDTVVKQIVDSAAKGTSARGAAILIKDNVTNRLLVKYVRGLYPPSKAFKMSSGITMTESMLIEKFKSEKIAIGEGLIGQVAQTGEPIYIPDAVKSQRYIQTCSEHMLVTSFIAVPLKSKEDIFGVLTIVDDSRVFLASDVSLIETLGEQAAITIKQIQMYQQILEKKQAEKEVGVAAEIQTSLVPHVFPETNKYEIYAFSIAAKGVGGDYYDYIDFGNNKVAVAMFDVSGKGVPAALIMVMIRSILRTIASLEEETKDVITKLNNTVSQDIVEDRYATGFYLLFDAEKGIMSYTNAGHGPLVLYRSAQDSFEYLDTEGMPVGIMAGVEYGMNYITLEKGDIAILYTDGITEAMNNSHEEFGMDRFKDVIRKNRRESSREISNRILEEVNRFVGTAPQHDDETLLVLKMK